MCRTLDQCCQLIATFSKFFQKVYSLILHQTHFLGLKLDVFDTIHNLATLAKVAKCAPDRRMCNPDLVVCKCWQKTMRKLQSPPLLKTFRIHSLRKYLHVHAWRLKLVLIWIPSFQAKKTCFLVCALIIEVQYFLHKMVACRDTFSK